MVDNIAASGVPVVGDLERLVHVSPSRLDGDRQPVVSVPPQVAATMAMGVLFASGGGRRATTNPDGTRGSAPTAGLLPMTAEPLETMRIPTYQLLGVLVGRVRRVATQRLGRMLRRGS